MNLHEEYILRHKLDVPIIQYDLNTCVVLRSIEPPYMWQVLRINWCDISNHPGYYILTLDEVVHNGYRRFFNRIKEVNIYCEEYETKILEFVKCLKSSFCAIPESEHVFALWKMFFYIFESDLREESKSISSLMYKILADFPAKEKEAACETLKSFLNHRFPSHFDKFMYNILPLSFNRSGWLVRLFNE